MRVILALLLITFSCSLVSCGYSMSGTGTLADGASGGYRSIAIPMFSNDTYEPLIEREVTAALKESVAYDGRLRLVDLDDADLVVEGRIARFELQPLTFDSSERIQEYRLKIVSVVKVIESSGEKVIWKDTRMESFADYRVTQDITKSKINKQEAIKRRPEISRKTS